MSVQVNIRLEEDLLNEIDALTKKIISKEKDILYLLIYLIIKLISTLPIVTTTMKSMRYFSIMNIIKTKLQNQINNH